jgi:O-acetyl-ADP-ribose deacetylase (regulator of RNase III)
MIHEVTGDLVTFDKADVLAHQCNTVTSRGRGLSAAVFKAFQEADTYSRRSSIRKTGEISVHAVGSGQRVVNMYAQRNPGKPHEKGDLAADRIRHFESCLARLADLRATIIKGVAFPRLIGCGLAGGHWPTYRRLLEDFARKIYPIPVYIVRLK